MTLSTFFSGVTGAVLLAASLTGCAGLNGGGPGAQDIKRVGVMHVGTDHVPPSLETLKTRLEELGWVEGKNVELLWRNLEPDAAAKQAKEFVRRRVDVIVAFEDTSIRAAQAATARKANAIPVVFLHPSDPVRDGLVESLARPGGNLTGVFGARDVVAKHLELYQLLVPQLRRLLTLVDPADPATKPLLKQYRAAESRLQHPLELVIREVSTARDLKRVFRSLRPGEVDGAFLLSPTLRLHFTSLAIRLADRVELPVHAHRTEWVEEGALFSYGADLRPVGRIAARYVDSILRGTSPSELPVEVFPDVEFSINLETASKLGIEVPQEMIIRADEVYR